jgi:hypothetical protein
MSAPLGGPVALERLRPLLPRDLRESVRSARELPGRPAASRETTLATGIPALDRLLDGGLPRGQLVEVVGARSSGRLSAALMTLAAVTGRGEAAALVDLGDGLDPALAVRLGVDLGRLLWVRPESLQHALAAAEILLGGGFPLVVADFGSPPVRGRNGEAPWLRLARAARDHGAVLWAGSPYRMSGTAAGAVLRLARLSPVWDRDGDRPLLAGISTEIVAEKLRGPGTRSAELELRIPGGEDRREPAAVEAMTVSAPRLHAVAV